MALPPQFLDELRLRTPLAPLIGRKTRLVRSGRNWKGCCPFHGEKTPSFYVYDDHFHCFGCGAHGDAITFVMRAEGASFPEAVERLANEAGLEVPKPTPEAAAREKRARDLHGVMEAAAAAFRRRLRLPEGAEGLAYLKRRGLTEETLERFGLGWSGAGRGTLIADLKGEGITPEQLLEAGLLREREDGPPTELFFNRVMFPIRDRRGRIISFGGRILGDGVPKYVNGPETPLFQKRRSLYALDLAREGAFRGGVVVAVEGYMDVIALHQAGFGAAVAPLGTALTEEQMEELWRLTPEPVLCFDGDAAGARAAARAAEAALPLLSTERSLKLATLPPGEDPDTLVVKGGPAAFQAVLDGARPLGEALYGLIAEGRPAATPEQRAALRKRLEEAAGAIKDRALAGEYRRALLDRFFQATRPVRPGQRQAPARFARPAITAERTRAAQAAALVAITLGHPWLLPEVEESLAGLDLGDGPLAQCRAGALAWLAEGHVLDSAGLMDHLAQVGLGEFCTRLLRDAGLPAAARPDAQPGEALDAWWHFFGLLRGETELRADQAAARQALAETNDAAAQRRLIRLTQALEALRRGEWNEGGGPEAAEASPAGANTTP
ncbi:DNA primase [Falsiroseomonas bella]|uniref:DNA primase n=1 Tax=Falsiroseomonas bella TaxID=2184016 RepID=A0A317FJI1_9PROT|nr:DNA primase [Falsiroseomonas bella]PWS38109.1 DNA primase [Falsiroseomonas bella]